jgi:hypothetical protein
MQVPVIVLPEPFIGDDLCLFGWTLDARMLVSRDRQVYAFTHFERSRAHV